MKCSNTIDVGNGKILHCCLEEGHEGAHQDDDGFPWEDNPQIYIGPIWLYRGAVVQKGEDTFIVKCVKNGRTKETSSVEVVNERTKNVLTVSFDILLRDYTHIGHRPSLARIL